MARFIRTLKSERALGSRSGRQESAMRESGRRTRHMEMDDSFMLMASTTRETFTMIDLMARASSITLTEWFIEAMFRRTNLMARVPKRTQMDPSSLGNSRPEPSATASKCGQMDPGSTALSRRTLSMDRVFMSGMTADVLRACG